MDDRTRHHRPARSGRSLLLLSSVLALLALACFPVLSQADSSGAQYSDPVPTAEGNSIPNPNGGAKTSNAETGGSTAPAGPSSGGSGGEYSGESPSSDSEGNTGDKAKNGGTGQGSPDKGSAPQQNTQVQPADQTPAPASSSDGGSSPLVPILLAVLALAAISIGVVMIRARRQRGSGNAPVSPRAS